MELAKKIARCLLPLDLPGEELDYLANAAIQAMEQRLGELTASVESARGQVEEFQAKYKMGYLEFKQHYLANPMGREEDYVTWGFWEKIIANKSMLLDQYQQLLTIRVD